MSDEVTRYKVVGRMLDPFVPTDNKVDVILDADHRRIVEGLEESERKALSSLLDISLKCDKLQSEEAEREARYMELIYAVGMKNEGETRHQTALRYIKQAESHTNGPAQEAPHD